MLIIGLFFASFRWGCKHEETARRQYEEVNKQLHSDLRVEDAGFRVSKEHPYIGASPDAYVRCSCCQSGILEIKCPFCAAEIGVDAASESKSFCLQKNDAGDLTLKRDHQYFYQVQMQLFVTDSSFCDFVVWTVKDESPFVQRILPDEEFYFSALSTVKDFFKAVSCQNCCQNVTLHLCQWHMIHQMYKSGVIVMNQNLV